MQPLEGVDSSALESAHKRAGRGIELQPTHDSTFGVPYEPGRVGAGSPSRGAHERCNPMAACEGTAESRIADLCVGSVKRGRLHESSGGQMRHAWTIRSVLSFVVLFACAGPEAQRTAVSDSSRECARLAGIYDTALRQAAICRPDAPGSCSVQRPWVRFERDAPSSLCWVESEGFLDPDRAGTVDAVLAQYQNEGCSIGTCPGLGPHPVRCHPLETGESSCGR